MRAGGVRSELDTVVQNRTEASCRAVTTSRSYDTPESV
jgi:hypothetical protein